MSKKTKHIGIRLSSDELEQLDRAIRIQSKLWGLKPSRSRTLRYALRQWIERILSIDTTS